MSVYDYDLNDIDDEWVFKQKYGQAWAKLYTQATLHV